MGAPLFFLVEAVLFHVYYMFIRPCQTQAARAGLGVYVAGQGIGGAGLNPLLSSWERI